MVARRRQWIVLEEPVAMRALALLQLVSLSPYASSTDIRRAAQYNASDIGGAGNRWLSETVHRWKQDTSRRCEGWGPKEPEVEDQQRYGGRREEATRSAI